MDVDGVEWCFVQRRADVRVREYTLRRSGDVELLVGTFCSCADLVHKRGIARRRSLLNVEIDPGARIDKAGAKTNVGHLPVQHGSAKRPWATRAAQERIPYLIRERLRLRVRGETRL